MKIHYCSDLHLEFGYQALPGGQVLILAGDIAEQRSITRHHHATKILQDTPIEDFRCSEFFRHECAKYDKVFYVMGNHEHYHGRFDRTRDLLAADMPANVTILERDVVEYCGVMFLGGTLWTNLNNHDDLTRFHLKSAMNDYRLVTNRYNQTTYHKLTPEYTAGVHRETVEYFKFILSENRDRKFVVITHHAPTFASISAKYVHDRLMNGGYASDLSELILDNDNIHYWIHGHIHDPVDYMVGSTRVISNPRGYKGWDGDTGFNPDAHFDINA